MRNHHRQDQGTSCSRAPAADILEVQRDIEEVSPEYPADQDVNGEKDVRGVIIFE